MLPLPTDAHLVLVGGGHAHVQILAAWAKIRTEKSKLTLICDREQTPYSGMLPGFLGGWYTHSEIHFDLPHLCKVHGAHFVLGKAELVDASAREIFLKNGSHIKYDLASFDVGSSPEPLQNFPSQTDHRILPLKPISDFFAKWSQLLKDLESWSEPNPPRVAMVGGGASGFEVILMLERVTQQFKVRPQLSLWQRDELLKGHNPIVRSLARRSLNKRAVELHENSPVTAWREGLLAVGAKGERSVPCDFVLLATPSASNPLFRMSGLPVDEKGFLKVNTQLQVVGEPRLFGAGDCIAFPQSLAKSGVYAVRQGPILCETFSRFLRGNGQALRFRPQNQTLALLTMGEPRVIASYGPLAWQGESLWRWKDRIDRGFMARFQRP